MSQLEKTLNALLAMERIPREASPVHRLDARLKLLVTLGVLTGVLSIPVQRLPWLILSFVYPVAVSAVAGIGYGGLLRRSLLVLPFVALVGIFNPWDSFTGILLRALVSMQAVLLLIQTTGFHRLCLALQGVGVPAVIARQLLFVHRYLAVLLQEALSMERARASRSYGRSSYPLRQWSVLVGQLLLRTLGRSERIHRAMQARGFK